MAIAIVIQSGVDTLPSWMATANEAPKPVAAATIALAIVGILDRTDTSPHLSVGAGNPESSERDHALTDQTRIWAWTILDRPGPHDHAPHWRGRCTYCGHRVAWKSPWPGAPHVHVPVKVIETRKQPWRIPWEMIMRYRAMLRGQAFGIVSLPISSNADANDV